MSSKTSFTCKPDRRNKSGRVGVSLHRDRRMCDGQLVLRTWYRARLGNRYQVFSVDALGERAAWREAVRLRERYERSVAAEQAAAEPVLHARQLAHTRRWRAKQTKPLNDPAYQAAWHRANREKTRAYRRKYAERDNARRRALAAERRDLK